MIRFFVGFGGYLVGLFLSTAFASPFAFWLIDSIMPEAFPFKRVFNRVLMVNALLLLWPLTKWWKISSWAAVGIAKTAKMFKDLVRGWGLGLITLGVVVALELAFDARIIALDMEPGDATGYFFGSSVLGFFEEILFRGVFYLAVVRLLNKSEAWNHKIIIAFFSSLFYSVTHFAKVQHIDTITLMSGITAWGTIFSYGTGIEYLIMRGISYFGVGMCLCALVERQGVLWGAMGLHAGWVFTLKTTERLTDMNPDSRWAHWIFGNDLVTGVDTYAMLIILFVVIAFPVYKGVTNEFRVQ
ncbi:MAG: CPBP family glutamic-type intramembrane protease [Verrucomicrobiota bacterium]